MPKVSGVGKYKTSDALRWRCNVRLCDDRCCLADKLADRLADLEKKTGKKSNAAYKRGKRQESWHMLQPMVIDKKKFSKTILRGRHIKGSQMWRKKRTQNLGT